MKKIILFMTMMVEVLVAQAGIDSPNDDRSKSRDKLA